VRFQSRQNARSYSELIQEIVSGSDPTYKFGVAIVPKKRRFFGNAKIGWHGTKST